MGMNPYQDIDTAIEQRRRLRARRRRLLYIRRSLIVFVAVVLVALIIATPIWIVRGIRAHQPVGGTDNTDTTTTLPTTTTTVPVDTTPKVDADTVSLNGLVESEYAVLFDVTTERVIAAKNADVQAFPASITKVMTVLVAVESIEDLDAEYRMPWQITTYVDPLATVAGFNAGDTMTLRDLLYGCILPSGADAAVALADYVIGEDAADIAEADAKFGQLMTRRAAELGAKNTQFVNVSGLHDSQHRTTAMDMALIMAEAMKNEVCREVLMAERYSSPATKRLPAEQLTGGEWISTLFGKWLGTDHYGILAGKTGYTDQAKHTLATYIVGKDGREYVFVSMYVSGKDKAIEDARRVSEAFCQ